jgi:hypothetical protein
MIAVTVDPIAPIPAVIRSAIPLRLYLYLSDQKRRTYDISKRLSTNKAFPYKSPMIVTGMLVVNMRERVFDQEKRISTLEPAHFCRLLAAESKGFEARDGIPSKTKTKTLLFSLHHIISVLCRQSASCTAAKFEPVRSLPSRLVCVFGLEAGLRWGSQGGGRDPAKCK